MIETRYPLGILRAWTWVDLGARALVYPQPLFIDQPEHVARRGEDGELIDPQGSDDFSDMRVYREGDPVRHMMWRVYARSDQLVVKEYTSYLDPRLMLDFDRVVGGVEERLSRLTGMALNAARSGREFGLVLPGMTIRPSVGDPASGFHFASTCAAWPSSSVTKPSRRSASDIKFRAPALRC